MLSFWELLSLVRIMVLSVHAQVDGIADLKLVKISYMSEKKNAALLVREINQ